MRAFLISLSLLLSSGAWAAPPEAQSFPEMTMPKSIVCDTLTQLAEIGLPLADEDVVLAQEVLLHYYKSLNDLGEPTCAVAALNGVIAIGNSVKMGRSEEGTVFWGIPMIVTTGNEYWYMWTEAAAGVKPMGLAV